jgi:hypothetical protein
LLDDDEEEAEDIVEDDWSRRLEAFETVCLEVSIFKDI